MYKIQRNLYLKDTLGAAIFVHIYANCSFSFVAMATDYVCGGEMFTHLHQVGPFSERHARVYVAEITLALEHLHNVSSLSLSLSLSLSISLSLSLSLSLFLLSFSPALILFSLFLFPPHSFTYTKIFLM